MESEINFNGVYGYNCQTFMDPIIVFNRVSFGYNGGSTHSAQVLNQISFEIFPGELAALVGSNGSGKTTLLRHINGLLLPQTGSVRIDGLLTGEKKNLAKIRQYVGMVFQFPEDQVVATTVAEDVAFGPENLGLPASEIRERVSEALSKVGLLEHANRSPHMLSGGQMQRLALAGVLAMRPRVVLFDEATTMLDPSGRRMTLEWMENLHREGMTVIFITHHMEEAALADRVIVLDRGRVAMDGSPEVVFSDSHRIAQYGLGLPRPARFADRFAPWFGKMNPRPLQPQDWLDRLPKPPMGFHGNSIPSPGNNTGGNDLIEVEQLDYTYMLGTPFAHQALKDLSLNVKEGSIVGLLGRTGSGKSTLLQHLNGILRPQKGKVRVGQFHLEDGNVPTKTVATFIGLVFQNPESQFFEQYAGDEIAFGPRQTGCAEPLAERVRWAMELVGLDFAAFKDRFVNTLSGGERRKVALAATLALKPKALLLDEPTAGLDPASHLDILGKLAGLQTQGMTIVLSSHRMNDLAALTQRLAVFQKGTVIREGSTGEVFWNFNDLAEAGLEPPLIVKTASRLRDLGWDIPSGIVTPDQLEKCLGDPLNNGVSIV